MRELWNEPGVSAKVKGDEKGQVRIGSSNLA